MLEDMTERDVQNAVADGRQHGAHDGRSAAAGGGDLIEVVVCYRPLDQDVEDSGSCGGRVRERVGEEQVHQVVAVVDHERVGKLRQGCAVEVLALEQVLRGGVVAAEDVVDAGDDAV